MSINQELLLATTHVAGVSIAIIAALLAMLQWRDRTPRLMLCLLFVALAASEADTVTEIVLSGMPAVIRDPLRMSSFAASFFIAPLIFFHVRELSVGRVSAGASRDWAGHLVLPGLAIATGAAFLLLAPEVREAMFSGVAFSDLPAGARAIALAFLSVEFLIYCQWLTYAIWIYRIQVEHLARLMQHFASTEGLELRWITGGGVLFGAYAILCLIRFLMRVFGAGDLIGAELDSFLVLVIVVVLALWGLRAPVELAEAAKTMAASPATPTRKYEKSALGSDQSARIARKLDAAMRHDRLYRDPNLNLSALARHLGVSINYLSQTLNGHLNLSFFDYVNGWRVQEATSLLETGGQSVLEIAYEVGFNSRSSFYTAFRKKTGQTPSAYKAEQAGVATVQT